MKIASGLFCKMVLQRNSRNISNAMIEGNCSEKGKVIARVTCDGKVIRGFANKAIGTAARKKFKATLKGLPTGGPYTVTLSVNSESITVRDICVGDVWVLAGQSNMEGIGHLKYACKPEKMVRAFYMHDCWEVAKDPIHDLAKAVDPVHEILCGGPPQRSRHVGVGPGVAFGQAMFKRTGVPQGLIACAHGGTSMGQWDPAKKKSGGKSLYGATVRRVRKNGNSIAGVAWYQGCSDANKDAAPKYTGRMKKLVAAMRRDFGSSSLPFVAVQISRHSADSDHKNWNFIQEQQRLLPKHITNCLVVPAIDLELDDGIHISGYDQNRLGGRIAEAMSVLTAGTKSTGVAPITLKRYRLRHDRTTGQVELVVTFSNVCRELIAHGRANGFYLKAGTPANRIFRIDLKGTTAILRLDVDMVTARKSVFGYGDGCDPYCNIVDAEDRSLPVFGPISLKSS